MATPENPPDPTPAAPSQPPPPSPSPSADPPAAPAQRTEDAEAVAALQNLAKPQPKPVAPDQRSPEPPDLGLSSGASGFVAMLARGQIGRPMPGGRKHPPERKSEPAETAAESEAQAVPHELLAAVAASARSGRRRVAAIPRWYRVAGPVLFTLAGLLIAVGLWGGGALIYMAHVEPAAHEEVRYPLITWSEEVGESGGYTEGSHLMAWLMLLACPPVALILGVSGVMIRRHMRAPGGAARA